MEKGPSRSRYHLSKDTDEHVGIFSIGKVGAMWVVVDDLERKVAGEFHTYFDAHEYILRELIRAYGDETMEVISK